MKTLFTLSLCLAASLAFGATAGSDNAGNYTSDGFTNGANQGTGFQAWNIFSEGSGGTFIGDSTDGSCGDINTSGQSFGMWGNPSGANYIHCYRKFAGGALGVGQIFTIKLGVNYRNGNKGLDVLGGGSVIFNVNVGGDDYTYHPTNAASTSLGWDYANNSVIECTFEQKTGNVLAVELKRGASEFSQEFSLPAPADEFQLYCGSTDPGSAENNFYANNMGIIPEPGALAGLALLVGLVVRARR
jgi:hypothetical protein